jgi:Fe-S-cluster-containing hydrogenase component 2
MEIFSHRNFRTMRYIQLQPRLCKGCWKCVEICPSDEFFKNNWAPRPHVHIQDMDTSNGGKKFVCVCDQAALEYIYIPGTKQEKVPIKALKTGKESIEE